MNPLQFYSYISTGAKVQIACLFNFNKHPAVPILYYPYRVIMLILAPVHIILAYLAVFLALPYALFLGRIPLFNFLWRLIVLLFYGIASLLFIIIVLPDARRFRADKDSENITADADIE